MEEFNPSNNQKIADLHRYLDQNAYTDTELWYGGHSEVNDIISTFTENDIEELVSDIKNWEPLYLTNLSYALTTDDSQDDPATRSYIYAHIFLVLADHHIFRILDDFSYLKNSDNRIFTILGDIRDKLNQFDFLNYDKISIRLAKELVEKLLGSA